MTIGYCKDHSGDCYCMWDKETGGILATHDITWLQWMYFPPKDTGHEVVCKIEDLDNNIPQAPNISAGERGVICGTDSNAETRDETTNMENTITRSGRVIQAPTQLIEVAGLSGNYEIKLIKVEVEY